MTFYLPPLSRCFSKAPVDHNIIVVGSGYGGGVAASRLARTGQAVTVLERGREIHPGEYPREMSAAMGEFQVHLSKTEEVLGKPDGLYDMRINDGVHVLVGCGLGGTSLINANVAIEADPRIFKHWPAPFSQNTDVLKPYYARAREMLGSTPYPRIKPKFEALKKVADGLGADCLRPDINVTFDGQHTKAGLWQPPCNDCGDCVSGCNYGAKNTVLMNYLLDAWRHDAQIFTGASVRYVTKIVDPKTHETSWAVTVGDRVLTAKTVILAAGTLGTTEILMRSRTKGLSVSAQLGQRFSGNGDVWAFGYNANMADGDDRLRVYGVGAGDRTVTAETQDRYLPGPCITGMIDLRDRTETLEDGLIIEEGVMPGALAAGYAAVLPMMEALMGDPFRFGDVTQRLKDAADLGAALIDDPSQLAETSYNGPVSRTLPYLVMSHDASDGVLKMAGDMIVVDWPDAGLDPAIVGDAQVLRQGSDAIKAEFMPLPFWQDAFGNRVMTVHPIGGCGMGDTAAEGVVNADCQVFDPDGGVHNGLYVCDGAALPHGVGVNPHLTITAVAERAMERLAEAQDWTIDWTDLAPLPKGDSADVLADPYNLLKRLMKPLRSCQVAIATNEYDDARNALEKAWKSVAIGYRIYVNSDTDPEFPIISADDLLVLVENDAVMKEAIGPALEQIITVLDAILVAHDDPDGPSLMSVLQDHMGDFSPPATLNETMVGHISANGLNDTPRPTRPYEVAAAVPEVTTLTTIIQTPHIRATLTPPDGIATITEGEFTSPFLGGTFDVEGEFAFLMPNTDKVECWEMRYSGKLIPKDHVGRTFTFNGIKTIKRREQSHWWTDLTEIELDIFHDDMLVAQGILVVGVEEAMRQASSVQIGYGGEDLRQAFENLYGDMQFDSETIKTLPDVLNNSEVRARVIQAMAYLLDRKAENSKAQSALEAASKQQVAARFVGTIARCYGDIYAYLMNFPAQDAGDDIPPADLPEPSVFYPSVGDDLTVKLTRYDGGGKGPVMLAGGFGTKASSFALSTVHTNLVQVLYRAGYDVWLFDYRGSGDIAASRQPFTLDDVAMVDWPSAISCVLENTPDDVVDVQTIVHCIGSMSLFMAVLAGETRVRSIIASQTGPHAVTNWANYAKADAGLARYVGEGLPENMWGLVDLMNLGPVLTSMAKTGVGTVEPRSPSLTMIGPDLDPAIDGLLWKVPNFAPTDCYSPTCHRINFFFGPSYHHPQLNQATHNAIRHLFGPVHPKPFQHIAKIFGQGHAVSMDGKTNYLDGVARMTMPVHFIAGDCNQEMMPEATIRSLKWLHDAFPDHQSRYSRKLIPHYGHMDCFIGKDAARDVFQHLLATLDDTT